MKKKFISSSNYFSGFSVDIDLDYCNNLNDIIIEFKKMLSFILKQFNFELLIDKLNNTNMHIHSYTFEDILLSDKDATFYICDCN